MVAFRALMRRPLTKPSPQADPRYRRVMDQLKAGAARTKTHPPASKRATEAAAAAKEPPNARLAQGKAKQVDKIKEAPAKKPESNSFLALLRAEIAKAMPKTLGDTEHFMEGGSAGAMKSGLKGNVSQQKQQATGDVAGASRQAPSPAGEAKPTTALPPDAAPPAPNVPANEGMPAPKSEGEVSVADSKQDTDQAMKEAEVTPQSLSNAHDKRFDAVNDARKEVVKQADAAPGKYRAAEKTTLASAASTAKAQAVRGAAEMIGVRRSSAARVGGRQRQQVSADEKRRQQFTAKLDEIFNATKTRVDAKLEALDGEVNTMFDAGVDAALNTMKAFVEDRIFRYKLDRYLSIPLLGAAAWIRDQFLGLPDEVNRFFEQGRQVFQASMDALIVRVANRVEQRLKEAKDEVARGQAAIKAEVASMPANLRSFAQQAASNYQSQFADLERGIEDKKNQLAQSLANKYKEAFDKANAALKEIQDANKGLVQAFAEKLGEVIKMLAEFKSKLMGLLRKGAETIKLILNDPLGFLSNLIAAVKGGISAFVGNIWAHLKRGFMQWLFGALASAGIEIPSDLSLVSIFKLVMGVLGITYDRMRAKAVKLIGERNVAIIEKLVEYIRVLIQGGPKALWEKVKEDLSSLKAMVIDAIQNWLIETVIKQAVAKIVSMFNPAGAIVQAIIAIYNIVMFVIEKAQQIMTFVEAVINSVHAIATGAIGGAIAWIERSLASAIPLVIGFLARLIGLGGISQKIRDFITKVQSKVDAAIDKAIAKVVALVKKLFGKGGKKETEAMTPGDKTANLNKALAEAAAIVAGGPAIEPVRGRLHAVKEKYKLTSLTVKEGGGEDSVIFTATMNPKVTKPAKTKPVSAKKKAQQAKGAAGKAKSAAKSMKEIGKAASKSGFKYADKRKSILAQRAGVTQLQAGTGEIKGFDAVFVIFEKGGGIVIEVVEIKTRRQLEVLIPVSSKKKNVPKPRPKIDIVVKSGKKGARGGSATSKHLLSNEPDLIAFLEGEKRIFQQGNDKQKRYVENKLSSLTTSFGTNMDQMIALLNDLDANPGLDPEVRKKIKNALKSKPVLLRFILDMKKDATISEGERDLAAEMIERSFKAYQDEHTKLDLDFEIIVRRADKKLKTTGEEKL